jgi:hypothetical protein
MIKNRFFWGGRLASGFFYAVITSKSGSQQRLIPRLSGAIANKLFISCSELTSLTRAQNSLLEMSVSGRHKDMSMCAEEFLPLPSAGFHACNWVSVNTPYFETMPPQVSPEAARWNFLPACCKRSSKKKNRWYDITHSRWRPRLESVKGLRVQLMSLLRKSPKKSLILSWYPRWWLASQTMSWRGQRLSTQRSTPCQRWARSRPLPGCSRWTELGQYPRMLPL